MMIARVVKWQTGIILAIDDQGCQIDECTGPADSVREKIFEFAGPGTKFQTADSLSGEAAPIDRVML